jgi:glycerol-3-phosphate acyltransferase PlsY
MSSEFVLLLVGGYLLGAIPTAYLAARWSRGVDIRQYGSGNVGAANLFRLTSKRIGIAVSIFDIVKGMPLVCVAHFLDLGIAEQAAIGVAAIIGHNWPVFLRFNGGRGMMTTLGVAFILPLVNWLVPWETIIAVAICFIGAFAIHNVPLGIGAAVAQAPLVSWIAYIFDKEPISMTWGFLAMFLIMVIRRLTAPKTSATASVSFGQLMVNRLLFDRDIRDREAWLRRQPLQPKRKKGKG